MGNEKTVTMTLKVDDQGTVVLDKFTSKINDAAKAVTGMGSAMQVLKWDAITDLAGKAYDAGAKIYDFGKQVAQTAFEISKFSQISGMGVEKWQQWSFAAKMAEVSD